MSNISRRDFLKTAGVMSLAVAASAFTACDAQTASSVISTVTTDDSDAAVAGYEVVKNSDTSITVGDYTISATIKQFKIMNPDRANGSDIYNVATSTFTHNYSDLYVVAAITIACTSGTGLNEFDAKLPFTISHLRAATNTNEGVDTAANLSNTAAHVMGLYTKGVCALMGVDNASTIVVTGDALLSGTANGNTVGRTSGGCRITVQKQNTNATRINVRPVAGSVSTGTKCTLLYGYKVEVANAGTLVANNTEASNRTYESPSITIGLQTLAQNGTWVGAGTLTPSIPSALRVDAVDLMGRISNNTPVRASSNVLDAVANS